MSGIVNILNRAISECKTSVVRCNGQHSIRIIEPHVIYTTKSGEIVVECFQTRGYTDSGNTPPLWIKFRITNIRSAYLLNDTFNVRLAEGFNPDKKDYKRGLLTMVQVPEPAPVDEPEEKSLPSFQARSLLGRLGSTIDNILSNQAIMNKTN